MSELWIANLTKQRQQFHYRLIDDTRQGPMPLFIFIEQGGQNRLPFRDLTDPQIRAIVDSHAAYGLTDVKDIDRTRPFIGLCYSVDKQVPIDAIRRGLAHNDGVLEKLGVEIRTQAALAVNKTVETQLPADQRPRSLEFEVQQENQEDYHGEGKPVHEVISVAQEGTEPRNPGNRAAAKKTRK